MPANLPAEIPADIPSELSEELPVGLPANSLPSGRTSHTTASDVVQTKREVPEVKEISSDEEEQGSTRKKVQTIKTVMPKQLPVELHVELPA